MTISIITCCYSPARLSDLFELLQSVRSQQYSSIETIVVVDRNVSLVAPIRDHLSTAGHAACTVLLNEAGRGVSAARNLGIVHANGEIVAFVDDDAVLMPGWAEATVNTYERDTSVIGLTGPVVPLWQEDGMSWWPREFYWLFSCTYWDWTEPHEVRNGYGVNLSFRREAFERCGLFETALGVNDRGGPGWQGPGGEEPDFSARVTAHTGKRILFHPDVRVTHKVYRYRTGLPFVSRRAFWEGYFKALFRVRYRNRPGLLSVERDFARRLVSDFAPATLHLLPRRPGEACKRTGLALLVVVAAALGAGSYYVRSAAGALASCSRRTRR